MEPKNVIKVLASQSDANCLRGQNHYLKYDIPCPSGEIPCKKCIWSLGDTTNIHLIEIVDTLGE